MDSGSLTRSKRRNISWKISATSAEAWRSRMDRKRRSARPYLCSTVATKTRRARLLTDTEILLHTPGDAAPLEQKVQCRVDHVKCFEIRLVYIAQCVGPPCRLAPERE